MLERTVTLSLRSLALSAAVITLAVVVLLPGARGAVASVPERVEMLVVPRPTADPDTRRAQRETAEIHVRRTYGAMIEALRGAKPAEGSRLTQAEVDARVNKAREELRAVRRAAFGAIGQLVREPDVNAYVANLEARADEPLPATVTVVLLAPSLQAAVDSAAQAMVGAVNQVVTATPEPSASPRPAGSSGGNAP